MLDPCGYLKATAPASVVTNGTQPSELGQKTWHFSIWISAGTYEARTRLRVLNFGIRGRADGAREICPSFDGS